MDNVQATKYLTSLLGKMFRVTTTDKRMFLGQFKCTDSDLNIVLAQTYEYRMPPIPKHAVRRSASQNSTTTLDLSSRFLGLVIIPGQYVTKIEVEELASQVRGSAKASGLDISGIKSSTEITTETSNGITYSKPEVVKEASGNNDVKRYTESL